MKRCLALVALLSTTTLHAATSPSGPAAWVLEYQNKTSHSFSEDPRTDALVAAAVPVALVAEVQNALSGKSDPVFIQMERYMVAAACSPRNCDDKGMLWIDAQTGSGMGAYYHAGKLLLGSNTIDSQKIPMWARQAVVDWLTDYSAVSSSVEFIDASGRRTTLVATPFQPREVFMPTAQGPGFDCKSVLSEGKIDQAVCHDAKVAALDARVEWLFRDLRINSATADAQTLLEVANRDWRTSRARSCRDAPDLHGCLMQYTTIHYDGLLAWPNHKQPPRS